MKEIKTEHGIFTDLTDREGNVIKTAEEYYDLWLEQKQIDNLTHIKTAEELTNENKQLWQIVEFLLKNTGFIPKEA